MKSYKTLTPAYDVSGGDENFEGIAFNGENHLVAQFYYTTINQVDAKFRLQESLDNVNFLDSLDSAGNTIEMTIDNSISTDILKVSDFTSAYIRFQYIEGTAATGTFDKIKIMME